MGGSVRSVAPSMKKVIGIYRIPTTGGVEIMGPGGTRKTATRLVLRFSEWPAAGLF